MIDTKNWEDIITSALEQGWEIEDKCIVPPKDDEASINNWAAEWTLVTYKEKQVYVPHWIRSRILEINLIRGIW